MRQAICVSRALLDGLQKKERLLVVYCAFILPIQHFRIGDVEFSSHIIIVGTMFIEIVLRLLCLYLRLKLTNTKQSVWLLLLNVSTS